MALPASGQRRYLGPVGCGGSQALTVTRAFLSDRRHDAVALVYE
jgi:hypothetical protein